MNNDSGPAHAGGKDSYAALRLPAFRLFLVGNFFAILGLQMQAVAILWEIWERTGSTKALGGVGLVQFLPVLALTFPAGYLADRMNRKHIVMACMLTLAISSMGLAWLSNRQGNLGAMYVCLLMSGSARALQQPAKASLLAQIVPREHFANAVSWNISAFQLAAVIGPALGGLMIEAAKSAVVVYLMDGVVAIVFFLALSQIKTPRFIPTGSSSTIRDFAAGIGFVWRTKVILASITLDLFAVLLGGATTLIPVFADILHVGAKEQGYMRLAPAVGALSMSFVVAHYPPQRAGRSLLLAVTGFGLATIVFGFSQWFWLSFAMLFLTGAFDNISVVVRHTLVQMLTPDSMRGRVSAVNGMFIGASNELGGFESGMVAHWFGPVFSVVSGGIGTLLVVASVMLLWPQLRRYGRLDGSIQIDPAEAGRGTSSVEGLGGGPPQVEANPHQSGVDEQVAGPGSIEGAGAVIEPGP